MMTRFIVFVLALMLTAGCGDAQIPQDKSVARDVVTDSSKFITVNYGFMMAPATNMLRAAWTDSVTQTERAYCLGVFNYSVQWAYDTLGNKLGRESIARVWSIDTATVIDATPGSIKSATCPSGGYLLHTHPPTTCSNLDDLSTCMHGGPGAWQCQPSRADYVELIRRKDRFAVVQCGPDEFRFYWPQEYRP